MTASGELQPAIALVHWPGHPGTPVMALLRRPVGRLFVDGAGRPVMAWQAEIMSAPPDGSHNRCAVVPRRPMALLATLTEPQADAIEKRLAMRGLIAALDDLGRIAEAGGLPDEAELDRAAAQAATLAVTEQMLARVPSGLPLAEIGFRPKTPDATDWYCSIVHGTLRAWVGARLHADGAWQLRAAVGEGDAREIRDSGLPAESCRGFVAARLIGLLGLEADEDAVPERLRLGVRHLRLSGDMCRLGAVVDTRQVNELGTGSSASVTKRIVT